MIMHFAEGPGKVKLIRKPKLIADMFDGQIRGVQQLHRPLHAQMI